MSPCLLRSDPAQQAGPEGGAPGGGPPGPPPNMSSNRRLQQTQAQVEEVVGVICVNVDKVLERDRRVSELDDRADALQAGASQFESSAGKLKRKYFWKNMKMMIILGVICAVVVVAIARKYCGGSEYKVGELLTSKMGPFGWGLGPGVANFTFAEDCLISSGEVSGAWRVTVLEKCPTP
ncbi:vesicle-associated membrane protein 1-like isoform X1 [Alligator sinensis]|uniref:Vesicle-associated membrane protein 1-like isoform X1 n=1 Tax=Alligator sinensis TaxID=38654 RepID=A0A1U8DDX0_ALLSI|nr:vesicle-associated membrane protein 1-like isoform X1 [Alligator sinensis]